MILELEKNRAGRDYVVGDIHANLNKLYNNLSEINFDFEKDRLFAVGDIIDSKGHNQYSYQSLKLLNEDWFFSVRGNHEDMMFQALINDDREIYDSWRNHGGKWIDDIDITQEQLKAELSEKYMPKLPVIIILNKEVAIVHAEIVNDKFFHGDIKNNVHKYYNTLVWGRNRIHKKYNTIVRGINKIYCGHTPVNEKLILGNHIFIDVRASYIEDKAFIIEEIIYTR